MTSLSDTRAIVIESMEMLNQPIAGTPVQHPHHTTDFGSIGSYMQQPSQQPSQMSGPYQRPSNGSNILEQHAMRPATTADSSNCDFNNQESSTNGAIMQSNNLQLQQSSMVVNSKSSMQPNQMGNSARLPSITLNNNNGYVQNESQPNCQHMNKCSYDQTICQNKMGSMATTEQLFSQQSMNAQQMGAQNPPRMNTILISQQHMGQQQHPIYHQNQQKPQPQTGMMQQCSNNHNISMGHTQNCNQMVSTYHQTSDQVSHLSHMDPPPPTQHSMSSISQSQHQQHSSQAPQNSQNSQNFISANLQSQSNPNQMVVQSSSNMTSPNRLPPLSFGSSNTQVNNQNNHNNIPLNANSTTQLLMALNNNSPISQEQFQEIQSMTCTAPDGTEMLLMQEPRLKQYSSLKEMSTIDLRSECKKRQFSSTGTKVKLSERLAPFEIEVLEERNTQLLKEYNHRQQMYEAQAATLKAFQAKKASLPVQISTQNFGDPAVSSNEISSTSQLVPTLTQQANGPPAKKKRTTKKKGQQQAEKQKGHTNAVITTSAATSMTMNMTSNCTSIMNGNMNNCQTISTTANMEQVCHTTNSNAASIEGGIMSILGPNNNQTSINLGAVSNQATQDTSSNNMFGNMNQPGSGFFMKDNSCFSHMGSGCRIISTNNSGDDNQNFGVFRSAVPPPPEDNNQFQQNGRQDFNITEQLGQPRNICQQRPMNLNQQQMLSINNNQPINPSISSMFNVPVQPTNQQQVKQTSQLNLLNGASQNGLQASPCVADQAGPSPNMPVSDPTATTSGSPPLVSSVVENTDSTGAASTEMMDVETMQQLLSPATIRAREELLTQQQTRINELVKLIQKNHDTLREQQMQINIAKKQQKIRQRQNAPPAVSLDKQVNSRCLQQAIKSRQNITVLNELTKQQDSIRTAETRLIEQLHINTATDDIARLIKQDGRTALVIVSLLHDYRTTREQNNRVKPIPEPAVSDKTAEAPTKKKAPPRKRNNNGAKVNGAQNKKAAQAQPDIEVVQVIPPPEQRQQQQMKTQTFLEFPQPQVPPRPRTQSDVDMEAIFKTVIDASRNTAVAAENQQKQPDNEIISLPSERSSPSRAQSQSSVQSGNSDYKMFQQDNSPQEMSFCGNMNLGSVSSCSSDMIQQTPNEMVQQQIQTDLSKKSEIVECLPHLDQTGLDQEMTNNSFYDPMIFNEDSNQEYLESNNQNNALDFDFPDIDQMVADIRDSDPLSCPLDDIDLTAILDSWTDNCDPKQNTHVPNQTMFQGQEMNMMCGNMMFDQNGQMDQMGRLHDDMDWNDYQTQTNIINQAFEQSQI